MVVYLKIPLIFTTVAWLLTIQKSVSFHTPYSISSFRSSGLLRTNSPRDGMLHMAKINEIDLKAELTSYLKKREELGADEVAKG